MTTENTNIVGGTLQGSLALEDFSFYMTDFAKTEISLSVSLTISTTYFT